MTELQEARLLGRAIRRWDIPDAQRSSTMERLYHLRDFAEKESTQLAAAAAIIAAEGQNQKDEHKFVDVRLQREHARLDAIASELGVDQAAIADATREASQSVGRIEGADQRDYA